AVQLSGNPIAAFSIRGARLRERIVRSKLDEAVGEVVELPDAVQMRFDDLFTGRCSASNPILDLEGAETDTRVRQVGRSFQTNPAVHPETSCSRAAMPVHLGPVSAP